MLEAEIKLFVGLADAYVRALREGMSHVDSLQRHEDNMLVWIIGLATGAVITVPAVLNRAANLPPLPPWMIGLSVGLYAFAILFGVAYRLLLAELMTHDNYFGVGRIHAVEALKFKRFEKVSDVDQARVDFLAIMNNKTDHIAKLKEKADRLSNYATRLRYFPYILFALGSVGTTIIGLYAFQCKIK